MSNDSCLSAVHPNTPPPKHIGNTCSSVFASCVVTFISYVLSVQLLGLAPSSRLIVRSTREGLSYAVPDATITSVEANKEQDQHAEEEFLESLAGILANQKGADKCDDQRA